MIDVRELASKRDSEPERDREISYHIIRVLRACARYIFANFVNCQLCN